MSEREETRQLLLRFDGFEGPLDLLLELARAQKLDLARISILALAEQYLDVIENAKALHLELAAEWLVMAAWLAWLKSRLLVPNDPLESELAAEAESTLTARLQTLQAMRAAATWLSARPILGRDVFGRGMPESFTNERRFWLLPELPALLRAYRDALRRNLARRPYVLPRLALWRIQDALQRLAAMLNDVRDWRSLEEFLPPHLTTPLERRAALASTLVAGLELARAGKLRLRQQEPFGQVWLHPAREGWQAQ